MRKPFNTFLPEAGGINENVFYSGQLNAVIRDMLLENVKDLLSEQDDAARKIYSLSASCLDELAGIKGKKSGPVLFYLQRLDGTCEFNLGLAVSRQDGLLLRKMLKRQNETGREPVRDKTDLNLEKVFSLARLAGADQKEISWSLDPYQEELSFLRLRFSVDCKKNNQ